MVDDDRSARFAAWLRVTSVASTGALHAFTMVGTALADGSQGCIHRPVNAACHSQPVREPRLEIEYCTQSEGGFGDVAEIKRRIRDVIAPQRELGHSDRQEPLAP